MDKREFDIFMAKKRETTSAGDIIPHDMCLIRSCGTPIYVMAVDQGWAMVRRIGNEIPEVFPVERLERVTSDGA